MSTLMNRLSELCAMAAGPVWNYPERMAEISRWLMRFFVLVVLVSVLLWISQQPVFTLRHVQIESAGDKDLQHVQLAMVRSQVLDKVQGNFLVCICRMLRKPLKLCHGSDKPAYVALGPMV